MNIHYLIASIQYWFLILLWLFIFVFYIRKIYLRKIQSKLFLTFLLILTIDSFRNFFESLYFGIWYSSIAEILPETIRSVLEKPSYILIPKSLNFVSALLIIFIILRFWIPQEEKERETEKNKIKDLDELVKELEVATRKLKDASKIGKSGWWEYDILNDKIIWPAETYAVYGLDQAKPISDYSQLLECIDTEYHEYHTQHLQHLYENGKAEFQYPITCPNGDKRWIWASGETEYDKDGNPIRLFGTLQDITERVEIDEQLRLQSQIITQVHDSVISVDMNGIISSWNTGSEHLFHFTADEAIGNHVTLIYPEKSHSMLRDELIPKLLKQESMEIEDVLQRKDGSRFEAITSLSVLRNESGDIIGMIGYTLDITKRKQAERAQANSERRLAEIIDFLPDPTWVISTEGTVVTWNKAIEKMTGIEKEEILGRGNYAYSIPFYGKARPCLIDLVINRDENYENEYISFKEENGFLTACQSFHPAMGEHGCYVAGSACRLCDANGNVVGAIETLRDITEDKHLELERERLIAELSNALEKVQTLSGLLPICASCKKIRDDTGYWNQIESYIENHSEALFSHSLCDECSDKLYGDKEWYKKVKAKRDAAAEDDSLSPESET